ncbi:hypothetical protein EPN28_02620 [Patescibacteria group bacterium]|nr:MAG: hypothetical protein EPN28_02620 [Patescibacteria group bacterium]
MEKFNPNEFVKYNDQTDSQEPQFKKFDDLPAKYKDQFKPAPGGGFARIEAEENINKARNMAIAENNRREAALAYQKKSERQLARIIAEAEEQGEIAGAAYEEGAEEKK